MEESRIPDHIDIGVIRNKLPQPLHGKFAGPGLPDVESNLMFKIFPVVGDRIVHMYRIPDQVCQKTDRIFMKIIRHIDDHTAVLIPPSPRIKRPPGGAIHYLPPACDIIPRVDLHQFTADPLHQGNGQRPSGGGVEACHNIALLDLFRIGSGPLVIFPCSIIGRIDPGIHTFEFFRVIGAVTVPDGIRSPAFQKFQGLRDHIHISGNGHLPRPALVVHNILSSCMAIFLNP